MKPPTPKARTLRRKLAALAERGIDGEMAEAKRKLAKLEAAFDFSIPEWDAKDLFGQFKYTPSAEARQVWRTVGFEPHLSNAVKWTITEATGIECQFRNCAELWANANPTTSRRLTGIASQLSVAFEALWKQFREAGAHPADEGNFYAGLSDGACGHVRTGTLLPTRPGKPEKARKAGRKALAKAPGLTAHAYTVGATLGKSVRFSASMEQLSGELESAIKGQIEA